MRMLRARREDEMCRQKSGPGPPRTDHAGRGTCHGSCDRDVCPDLASFNAAGILLRGWVWCPSSTRQVARPAREDLKDGAARHRPLLVSGAMAVLQAVERFGHPEQCLAKRLLTQSPYGCRDCAGQQNGTWPLGHDDEERGLPKSGGDDGVAECASRRPGKLGV